MSYNKNTWQTGDVVTAQKLNNMENGIANASLFIATITSDNDDNLVCDKTVEEIMSAVNNGTLVLFHSVSNSAYLYVTQINVENNTIVAASVIFEPTLGADVIEELTYTQNGIVITDYRIQV